jgi:hypothetical protein
LEIHHPSELKCSGVGNSDVPTRPPQKNLK